MSMFSLGQVGSMESSIVVAFMHANKECHP
jgi:hypothetical protein